MGASGLGANEISSDEMDRLTQFAELMMERAAVLETEIEAARLRAGMPPKKPKAESSPNGETKPRKLEYSDVGGEASSGTVDGVRLVRGVNKF